MQDIVRRLRKAGGLTNNSCGIHIHLDGSAHTPRSIRNFINLIASRNDLFYKALQIEDERMRYCKKMDAYLVERMNQKKPRTFAQLEEIWYSGYGGNRNGHYHDSRYHFLNLHCFFHGNHTIELRGFNSALHAGKVRAYIVFALAMNHQALTQKSASYRKVQEENEKFAMRVYLNRIGFIGEEFKSCRKHLYEHLDGNAAWRYGSKENAVAVVRNLLLKHRKEAVMPKIEHETKKAEAIRWMNILGIDPDVIQKFKDQGIVSACSGISGGFIPLDDPELLEEIHRFEQEWDNLVYFVVRTPSTYGSWTLFFSQTTILTNGSFQEKNLKTVTL